MTNMKEYAGMTVSGQENFLSHASADLVQKMYYENNRKGLEVVVKNLTAVLERAKDCIDCLDMLNRNGDVFSKIYLLLEYMGKGGISEEFVSGLEEITERAQETLAKASGVLPVANEEREILKRIGSLMDRHEMIVDMEAHDNSAKKDTQPDDTASREKAPEERRTPEPNVKPVNPPAPRPAETVKPTAGATVPTVPTVPVVSRIPTTVQPKAPAVQGAHVTIAKTA